MASPKTAIERLDLSLTFNEFSAAMNRRNFIGHLVFPQIRVQKESSKFLRLNVEAGLPPIEDTKRAPKATYKRDDFEWTTDSYETQEHGVEEITDDHMIDQYGEIAAEAINRDRGLQRICQAYEAACADAAFDAGYFTGNYTVDLDQTTGGYNGNPWNTKNSADPIGDIDLAREAFKMNCGYSPNAIVIEEKAVLAALRTDRIEDLTKYTGNLDSHTMRQLLPQLADIWQLERVIVARSPLKNTAAKGETATFARIWDPTKALLCKIYDGPDLEAAEPFLGRTIMWSPEAGVPGTDDPLGVIVEEYREEARRGGVIRTRTNYELKRFHKPAGLLLTNVTKTGG